MFSILIKNFNISKQIFATSLANAQTNSNLNKTISILYSKNFQEQKETKTESKPEDNSDLDELYKLVRIEVRGHEDAVLSSYSSFIRLTASCLDLKKNLGSIRKPHRFIERWTVLKAKYVKKKKFVQYEMRTYYRIYEFKYLTGSTCSTLLEYIQRNLPAGVSMYVTKTRLECLPESISKRPSKIEVEKK